MWKLKNIPKIAHFYWDSPNGLSYLRYMTIFSFMKLNPDWRVIIHSSIELYKQDVTWVSNEHKKLRVTGECDSKLKEIKNIEYVKHDFTKYGFTNNVPEVFKCDFLRWKMLGEVGGLWSDFDIVYTHPMTNCSFNTEVNENINTTVCMYPCTDHSIGFLMSSQNNHFFTHLHKLSFRYFTPRMYQSIGATILNENFRGHDLEKIKNLKKEIVPISIPMKTVYKIDVNSIQDFWLNEKTPWDEPDVVGLHWYAGHPLSQEYDQKITESNLGEFKNTIANSIRRLI